MWLSSSFVIIPDLEYVYGVPILLAISFLVLVVASIISLQPHLTFRMLTFDAACL